MAEPTPDAPLALRPPEDRLDSWKDIAAYLNRDVTTVQRWEKREAMPVHRHLDGKIGSVYASRVELEAWSRSRNLRPAHENRLRWSATSRHGDGREFVFERVQQRSDVVLLDRP